MDGVGIAAALGERFHCRRLSAGPSCRLRRLRSSFFALHDLRETVHNRATSRLAAGLRHGLCFRLHELHELPQRLLFVLLMFKLRGRDGSARFLYGPGALHELHRLAARGTGRSGS
jgi:hypothetical protein